MTELNRLHQRRWEHARALIESLKRVAAEHDALLMFDQAIITPSQLHIEENAIRVRIDNCSWLLFEADPDYDHGLYDTVKSFRDDMKERFKLVKELKW